MKYLTLEKAIGAWKKIQPLSENDRQKLSRRFTVDFNYNSNHIEGNTLTYGQTEILLLFGIRHGRTPYLASSKSRGIA